MARRNLRLMAWTIAMPENQAYSTRSRLDNMLFYGVVALLAYLVYRVFEPFLAPLGWAGVLVVVFYPLHKRLERRMSCTAAALMSTLGVTLVLILPVLALMALSVREAAGIVHNLVPAAGTGWPTWSDIANISSVSDLSNLPGAPGRFGAWLNSELLAHSSIDIAGDTQKAAVFVASFLGSKLGSIFRDLVVFLFDLFVTLFALFYIFRDADWIVDSFRRLLPFPPAARDRILDEARDLINASVTTSFAIGAVHGIVGGVAFAVVGIGAPIFWGVIMAFFAMLPVVGAWPIWLPAALYLFATGHWGRAIALLALSAVVAGVADYVLRPLLIGNRSQLSGLVIFVSVLGGVAVFGPLGIVLGPIVVATATSLFAGASRTTRHGEGPAVAHSS